ncbi:sigma-70 family RNA polymerase sigma factor [Arthrobacter sp. SIMBA_036]|uniref:sigma-70 family RNA polymerase sigma factor n=1 Tax=Arthrobacter sp. SIMBA_036 TaxID=3085778 RepID=UPI0039782B30
MAQSTGTGGNVHGSLDSDGHLIELVRSGDMSAFDDLYERHLSIASAVARRNVDNPSDAEDVVAEAFQSVLQSLMAGKGPDNFFRAYLLSTVTRLSHHRNRKAGKTLPSGDDSLLDRASAEPDVAIKAFESQTVAKAFRSLPERWQAVLWYLDVERMKPAAVAPILGLSPNAVSALALRAREGLRREYLQAHIAEEKNAGCAEYAGKLGSFIRGGLSTAAERKVRAHLNGCSKCTAALGELKDVQSTMRAVLLPMITGIPAAAWAGKGAGLGIIGGLAPIKAAVAVPTIAQPAVMAVVAAAGLGLALGAVGLVDLLTPDYMEQRAAQASTSQQLQSVKPSASAPPPNPQTPSATVPPAKVPTAAAPPVVVPAVPPAAPPPAVVRPTSTPIPTPVPSPSSSRPSPPRVDVPAPVDASVKDISAGPRTVTMGVTFTVGGSQALGPGKVVFSVGRAESIPMKLVDAPEGWSCSVQASNVVTCTTPSIQRRELHFQVTAVSQRRSQGGVLTYSLSGQGIAPGDFVHKY